MSCHCGREIASRCFNLLIPDSALSSLKSEPLSLQPIVNCFVVGAASDVIGPPRIVRQRNVQQPSQADFGGSSSNKT